MWTAHELRKGLEDMIESLSSDAAKAWLKAELSRIHRQKLDAGAEAAQAWLRKELLRGYRCKLEEPGPHPQAAEAEQYYWRSLKKLHARTHSDEYIDDMAWLFDENPPQVVTSDEH